MYSLPDIQGVHEFANPRVPQPGSHTVDFDSRLRLPLLYSLEAVRTVTQGPIYTAANARDLVHCDAGVLRNALARSVIGL